MTIAIILSLIILTPIAKIFDGTGMIFLTATETEDYPTDLEFLPFMKFSNITEGFSFGRLNNEGYNDIIDYESGMSLDVLIMGSSNIQGFQIMPRENVTVLLGELSGKRIYNIGMHKHYFPNCANNLKAAIEKYKPSEYVVIETMFTKFTDQELEEILSRQASKVKIVTSTESGADFVHRIYYRYIRAGVHKLLTKSYSLNFLYSALISIMKRNAAGESVADTHASDPVLLSRVLNQMSEIARNSGVKLIIAYHPAVRLDNDGTLRIDEDPEAVKIFAEACEANGIFFVDTGERFLTEYEKNFTVPNGFFNTSVGNGHLNRYGHRIFAEEIHKKISGLH